MKKGLLLLLAKNESCLLKFEGKDLQTRSGILKAEELARKKFGDRIKTHLGKEFVLVKPTLTDFLAKAKRLQQVILPKDAASILAVTGIGPGNNVVDVGTGSGWVAIFLAYYVRPGKVYTYEKDPRALKVARENIQASGLKNIVLREVDASKGLKEKDVDLVCIDIKNPEKVLDHAYQSLKVGGWVVVYSPYVEQVVEVRKKMQEKFSFISTLENIVREWQFRLTLRPKTLGLMHTGWLTFGRKVE